MTGIPIFRIWKYPRRTVREALDTPSLKRDLLLASIGGLVMMHHIAQNNLWGLKHSLTTILLIVILAGPLFGMIYYSFFSWLMSKTARWFKGTADFRQTFTATTHAAIPFFYIGLIEIVELAVLGKEAYLANEYKMAEGIPLDFGLWLTVLSAVILLPIILAIMVGIIIIYLKSISEANGYNISSAIWHSVVSFLIVALVMAPVSGLFFMAGMGSWLLDSFVIH